VSRSGKRKRRKAERWVEDQDPQALRLHRASKLLQEERTKTRALLAALEMANTRVDIALAISEPKPPKPIKARLRSKGKREATAVICASDWHIEERVTLESTNGLNEYSLAISKARSERFFDGAAWLVNHHAAAFSIKDVVLWLGGDLVTGWIHEELKENNPITPIEAVLRAQDYIAAGIVHLLESTGCERLIIPANYGNHGRTTKKRRSAGASTSYEWLMYQQLSRQFADDPRVEFHIADGAQVYLDVYSFRIRFMHGDDIRGGGGIGGLSIPISKWVLRSDKARPTHLTVMGHFHTLCDFGQPAVIVNGSLIGPSPYGLSLGYAEEPKQAFFLVDKRYGKCQSTPIWVTK